MKKIAAFRLGLLIFILIGTSLKAKSQYQTPDSIVKYIDFLGAQKLSAKEYILDLLDRYDIVIFGERTHMEFSQYELLKDLFSDKRFQNKVGDIFMEIGGSNFDKKINKYLLSPNLTKEQSIEKALEIQQNSSWYPIWDRYNYHYLLTSLYDINRNLPLNKKLKLHPTDIPIDWSKIITENDVKEYIANLKVQDSRDSVMAANLIAYIAQNSKRKSNRKKYFVIWNLPHASKGTWQLGNDIRIKSAASYIFEKFPTNTANVMINTESGKGIFSANQGGLETVPILDGKFDAALEYMGINDVGFDLKNSPLQGELFENFPMTDSLATNEKIFTGFVFYKAYPEQKFVTGIPGILSPKFLNELKRRVEIFPIFNSSQISKLNYADYKTPPDLVTYWQKVEYWSGGGKPLIGYYQKVKSIDEMIEFILKERAKGSNTFYKVSEIGLNEFGYALNSFGKIDDALRIFRLNTELYPNSWNTYDSYGELLLKVGKIEDAKDAYQKSLKLNPGNTTAKRVLEKSIN